MRAEDQQVMIRPAPGRADRFSVGDADSFPRGFVWAKLSRFQRLAAHISNPWGDAPGYDEIAPMALER